MSDKNLFNMITQDPAEQFVIKAKMKVRQQILARIEELNVTKKKAAELASMDGPSISRILNSVGGVSLEALYKLAYKLEVKQFRDDSMTFPDKELLGWSHSRKS